MVHVHGAPCTCAALRTVEVELRSHGLACCGHAPRSLRNRRSRGRRRNGRGVRRDRHAPRPSRRHQLSWVRDSPVEAGCPQQDARSASTAVIDCWPRSRSSGSSSQWVFSRSSSRVAGIRSPASFGSTSNRPRARGFQERTTSRDSPSHLTGALDSLYLRREYSSARQIPTDRRRAVSRSNGSIAPVSARRWRVRKPPRQR